MLSSNGIMCRQCLDALYPQGLNIIFTPDYAERSAICTCKNLAVIWDEDVTPRIYVEDITTVQPIIVFHTEDYQEVQRVLLEPLSKALYVDVPFKNTPLNYQELAKKNKYIRKTSTTYNKDLMAALDRHKYHTSDGKEEFKRTTLSNPLKEV